MVIRFYDSFNTVDKDFGNYLKKCVYSILVESISKSDIDKLNLYFENTSPYKEAKISVNNVFRVLQNAISYHNFGTHHIVQIDMNKKYPKTNIKLFTLCNLIDYGNLELPKTKLFSRTFKYLENNISSCYSLYIHSIS